MRALRLLSAAFVAIGLLAFAPAASAKAKVDVAAVEFKEGAAEKKAQKRIGTTIRRQAHRAAKHLDFGTKGRVEITFAVRDIKVEEADGVVTITCTLLGKLKGGGSAKSKIRFGGKPENQTKVERQVVAAATDGVMTRLAQLSREQAAAKAKAEKEEKERGDD